MPPRRVTVLTLSAMAAVACYRFCEWQTFERVSTAMEAKAEVANPALFDDDSTTCARLGRRVRPLRLSPQHWWDQIRPLIAEVSDGMGDSIDREAFRHWVGTQLLPFYTTKRMRTSVGSPLGYENMQRLLKVLDAFETTEEPLRVYVLGGSVTWGLGSCDNPTAHPTATKGTHMALQCSWANRLEVLLNRLFEKLYEPEKSSGRITFEDYAANVTKRVKVSNLAVPGTSSDTGAMAFKYRVFKGEGVDPINKPPHLVLLAYSANDSRYNGFDSEVNMQDITDAAKGLWPCDDTLPVLGYVNDFFLFHIKKPTEAIALAHKYNAHLYAHASWNRLWMVDYANMVRLLDRPLHRPPRQ